MFGRFQNRNWNDVSFSGYSQSQFNYHDQVPHHGWDLCYAGGTYVPHQTSGPTIPAVGPLHQPQPVTYCKICEVKLGSYKNMESHNNGKKHQRMLNLHEEERLRTSNWQVPNSQVDLVVQPKTVLTSGKNGWPEKKVSYEATVAKHKNYLPRDIVNPPEVPAEGKPRDNTSAQGHNLKRKIGGAKTGKYMKTNDGLRRPMESSKLDINSVSKSIESPVQIPTLTPQPGVTSHLRTSPFVGSSFKFVHQHLLSLQTQVLEGKEYHEIQNPTVETNDRPHALVDSNINTQPEDVISDPAARTERPPKMGYCKVCEVHLPNCKSNQLELHSKGKRHQNMLRHQKMLRHQRELKLQEELERRKASNGQIPNSLKNLVVKPKTGQISGKNEHKHISSEDSILKHKNYLQEGMGLTSEIAAKGPEMKPKDNSGVHGHGFKLKTRGTKAGKYIKTNHGVRRPMESLELNTNSLSKSVESHVQNSIPALVPQPGPVRSSFELQFQQVSASQTPLSDGEEHYAIKNSTVEVTDQPHVPADCNINTRTEDMSSDSAAIAMASSVGFMASQVFSPSLTMKSSFEPQIQLVLQTLVVESKEHHEIQNPTLETNGKPQSISIELHAPAGSDISFQTEDVTSDSGAMPIEPTSQVSIPPTTVGSSFEPQIQHVLHVETEPQISKDTKDSESQNYTDEKNNQLLPSVEVEFNSPSGSNASTQTAYGCSKAKQKLNILTHQLRTTQLSQVAVCLKCGDAGFLETHVFCNKCQLYSLHRYCLDGPVIFTDDVTWLCEDCEPKVVETSFHDQYTLLPSGQNVSLNSENDASQARIDPKTCLEKRVKNTQGPQNIAAKTMVLLSDNHSLSHHVLSQCSNNTEKEIMFVKECQPVPKDEANTSEGSMMASVPRPIADPVWRGSLRLLDPSFGPIVGIVAHMSTLACSKVLEETRLFPDVLCPDLVPRSAVWPKSFMKCGPNEDSIALYFFPDTETVERAFDKLVDDMTSSDLAIRAVVENAEILIFPSTLLPIQCRRFQEKYFLWGVFRAKKTSHNKNDAVCVEVTTSIVRP